MHFWNWATGHRKIEHTLSKLIVNGRTWLDVLSPRDCERSSEGQFLNVHNSADANVFLWVNALSLSSVRVILLTWLLEELGGNTAVLVRFTVLYGELAGSSRHFGDTPVTAETLAWRDISNSCRSERKRGRW